MAMAKPKGWQFDNVFLGRWQGQSTAGQAVIDVLTVEPNRIRWGNPINGICDSDYSVTQLPWGRHGRYPDQLVPPSAPSDLVFGVVRLTLQPAPCSTGDAVIQLAIPLDGTSALGDGQSQWITSTQARADGHHWRARACAWSILPSVSDSASPGLASKRRSGLSSWLYSPDRSSA